MGSILEAIGLKQKRRKVRIPEPPPEIDEEGALAAERERRRRRQGGRASTILTGPLGLSGQANIATKTLLGK